METGDLGDYRRSVGLERVARHGLNMVKSPKTWSALIGAVALGALAGVGLFVGPKAPPLKALNKIPTYGKVLTTVGAVAIGGTVGFGVTYIGKKVKDRFRGPSGYYAIPTDDGLQYDPIGNDRDYSF